MDTVQLNFIGSSLCHQFNAALAADEITIRNGYFIVNVGKKNTKGSHWVCIYFDPTCSEFFDPAGKHPLVYHRSWHDMMLSHSGRYKYNSKPVQAPLTSTCGQFVLYYLFNRYHGRSMEDIVRSLENDSLNGNEKRVTQYVSRLIDMIV